MEKITEDFLKKERKYIIYVGGFILPDKNAAAHRVLSNAKLLKSLGYEVVLVGVSKSKLSLDFFDTIKNYQGFESYEICYPKTNIEWIRYLTSIKNLKKITHLFGLNKVHSIIVYNYPSFSLFRIINFCKRNQIKLIADSTEWYTAEKKFWLFRIIKNLDNTLRMKYLHYKCDGIICISKFLKDFYDKKVNTILLPPLVDLNETKWFTQFPPLNNIKEFTYVGSPGSSGEKESFDMIFHAFLKLSKKYNFIFNIIGVSKDEIIKNSKISIQIIEELGDKIKFWGIIGNNECIRLINKSHFFIFFRFDTITTQAGFPTKFVESISSGTPVLTNKTSNIEDFIVEGKNGFWIDKENIENQLEYCMQMPIINIKEMKEYCLKSKVFDFTYYIQKMSCYLNKL